MINIDLKTENLVFSHTSGSAFLGQHVPTITTNSSSNNNSNSNSNSSSNSNSGSSNNKMPGSWTDMPFIEASSSSSIAVVKIIDFGMAVSLWDRNEHFEDKVAGTSAFLAPETIIHYERFGQAVYSRASDIWQAGCILYMILAAQYPFGSENSISTDRLIENIKSCRFSVEGLNLSADAQDLLKRIFVLDPNERITAREILNHPWIMNQTQLPETDLGDIYKNRLKNWSCRKRFRQLLDHNVLGSRGRQYALQSALLQSKPVIEPSAASTTATTSTSREPSMDQLNVDTSTVDYMTRSDTSTDYMTSTANQSPNASHRLGSIGTGTNKASVLKQSSSAFLSLATPAPSTALALSTFAITNADIQTLKQTYYSYISKQKATRSSALPPVAAPNSSATTLPPLAPTQATTGSNVINPCTNDDTTGNIITPKLDISMIRKSRLGQLNADGSVHLTSELTPKSSDIHEESPTTPTNNTITNSTHNYNITDQSNTNITEKPIRTQLPNIIQPQPGIALNQVLHFANINYQAFHEIVLAAKFPNLATEAVFEVFDWNKDGTLDFFEFLFTLSSFRKDLDWNDAASVARLYYDIFDMNSSNSISVDVLALVLHKLLISNDPTSAEAELVPNTSVDTLPDQAESSPSAQMITVAGISTTVSPPPTGRTNSNAVSNALMLQSGDEKDDVSKVLDVMAIADSDQASSSSIYDIVQSIDSDEDGEITFKDFEAFFNVILHLRSISSR